VASDDFMIVMTERIPKRGVLRIDERVGRNRIISRSQPKGPGVPHALYPILMSTIVVSECWKCKLTAFSVLNRRSLGAIEIIFGTVFEIRC
jgi:hypothetical protein